MPVCIGDVLKTNLLPPLEIRMLLEFVMQLNHAQLIAFPERAVDEQQRQDFSALVQRRLAGEPMAYLVGAREFFSLRFACTPAALIPRPETELLVEMALSRVALSGTPRILDLGTGSGVIALTLGVQRPNARICAVDISLAALALARQNATALDVTNVEFVQGDWFGAVPGQHFDIIVSNPPYIAATDSHLSQGDLRFEPSLALQAGDDGLHALRQIAGDAPLYLNAGGWLMLEHGYDQAESCRNLLAQSGFTDIISSADLAGIPRVSTGRAPA